MAGEFENRGLKTFVSGIETSARRLKSNIEAIIEKYNKPFARDDEINLSTLTVQKDRGCVRKIKGVHKFGASQLKSTKRRDELFKSQMGQLEGPANLNVSMAIARHYVSYLSDSNVKEDEPSDAETLSSDSSGDDEDDEEDTDDSEVISIEDEEDLSDRSEVSIIDKCDTDENLSDRSEVTIIDKRGTIVENGSNCFNENDEQEFTVMKLNKTATLDSCNDSLFNTSISSSLRNLSFVTIQSPKQKSSDRLKKKPSSDDSSTTDSHKLQMAKSSNDTFLLKKQAPSCVTRSHKDFDSDYCLRSRRSASRKADDSVQREKFELNASKSVSTRNNSKSCCDNKSASFLTLKSPVKDSVNISKLPKNLCQRVTVPTSSTSHSNKNMGKSSSKKTLAHQALVSKEIFLGSETSQEKLFMSDEHPQKNSETFIVSGETKSIKSSLTVQSSAQTINPPQNGPISESRFKSPQGIKVKRICPITLVYGKSTQASHLQSQFTSYSQRKDTSSLMRTGTKDLSFNPSVTISKLHSDLESSCQRTSVDSSTVLCDVSFSSSEDEDVQNDVLQKCSVLLEPAIVPVPQKEKGESHVANKQVSVLSIEREAATNSPGDTSLTSSLKRLYIHPHSPITCLLSSHFSTCDSSVSEKQSNVFSLLHTTQQSADEHVNCLVKSGLYVGSPVNVKQAGNNVLENCKCNKNINSLFRDGQRTGMSHGFDQKKWLSAAKEITIPANKILSPTQGRLKRKASGSFTSGYFTDASASPQCLQSGYNSSLENNTLAVNTTFTLPSVSNKHLSEISDHIEGQNNLHQRDHAVSCCLHRHLQPCSQNERSENACCQVDQVEQEGAKAISNSYNLRHRSSALNSDKNMDRKFAVAKKKLKSLSGMYLPTEDTNFGSSLQSAVDNQCRVCSTQVSRHGNWQKHQQVLSEAKDQRVCEWVEASNKTADPGTAVHYSSCPPKLQHSCFLHYPECSLHHIYNNCSHHSKAVLARQSQCKTLCYYSLPGVLNHTPANQQSPSCTNAVNCIHCFHYTCQSVCRGDQRTEHDGSRVSADTILQSCQHQNCNASNHLKHSGTCSPFKNGVHDSLSRRAHGVWKEIQAERSDLDGQEGNASMFIDKPVSDSLSSFCHSEYGSEVDGESNFVDGEVIHGSKRSSQLPVPRIGSFLKSGLDKAISGDFSSRSFVQAHGPAPKLKSTYFTKTSLSNGLRNNTMFPDAYIEQFSPLNPRRRDSDESTLECKQVLPMKKDSFKNFRPRRHNNKPSIKSSIGSEKPSSLHHNDSKNIDNRSQCLPCQSNPPKRRNVSHSSNHNSCNRGQFVETGCPNYFYTQKKCSNCITGDKFKFGQTTSTVFGNRASTPFRQLLKMPEINFDDSISTIASAHMSDVNEKLNDEESRDCSVIAQADTLIQDWDSNEEVDLL